MATNPPPPTLDLLIVGALTIDRFADGSTAPGGSVLHGARGAARAGMRVGIVTVAGPEPQARNGLEELRRLGWLHAEPAAATVTFRHESLAGLRRLTLEVSAGQLVCPPAAVAPAAVLYAPVAGELDANLGGQLHEGAFAAASLQGWLRRLEVGRAVEALPLRAVDSHLVARLRRMDLLVLSREDLAASTSSAGPGGDQLDAIRALVGNDPLIALTDGLAGAHLDHRGSRMVVPAAGVVHEVPTVGAGDVFAALLAAFLAARPRPFDLARAADAARAAADGVVTMLEGRRETSGRGSG